MTHTRRWDIQVAVARALSDLGRRLLQATAEDIENVTHKPVHLDR